MKIEYAPIGYVRSPIKDVAFSPIQAVYAQEIEGTVELLPQYAEALEGLEGFSHVHLLFHFHMAKAVCGLRTKPYLLDRLMGVFATRTPCRPNPIGLSVVRLLGIEGNILRLGSLDLVDGTPVLDVKPYVSRFDRVDGSVDGWHHEISDAEAAQIGRKGGPPREGFCK